MEYLISYISNDAECFSAVKELEDGCDMLTWLRSYRNLYLNVTYGPIGMPRITDSHYEGRHFESITHFSDVYIKTFYSTLDPFSDPTDTYNF